MTASEVINLLTEKGVKLSVINGQLRYDAPKGIINKEIINELRNNKEEIIRIITESSKKSNYQKIEKAEEKEYYTLSSVQKRLYFLNQLEKESIAYNVSGLLKLEGQLDLKKLEESFKKLIERHESLRTCFKMEKGVIVQRIYKEVKFKVEYIEIEGAKVEESAKDFIKPFDLNIAPLLRVRLIKEKEDKHILLFDMHHIISDETSSRILAREFLKVYNGEKLKGLRIQYKDFAVWQNKMIESEAIKKQEEYWLKRFSGEISIMNLPVDYQRPSVMDYKGKTVSIKIDEDLVKELRNFSAKNNATLFMTIFTAFYVFFLKLTGQEDITFGIAQSGRNHIELEGIVGMFINTLAFRNYPKFNKKFIDFFEEVKENAIKDFANNNYPFEMLLEKIELKREQNRTPLFDVLFDYIDNSNMENIGGGKNEINGLKISLYEIENGSAMFDMGYIINVYEKSIKIKCQYRTSIYRGETIEYLLREYVKLLKEIVNSPEKKLKGYEILNTSNLLGIKKRIEPKNEFDRVEVGVRDGTIVEYFNKAVKKNKDNVAIRSRDKEYTYKELDERSNRVGNLIFEEARGNAGLLFEHEAEMIVGMMGVLKTGRIYVPLDPTYPEDRLRYMIKDSEARIIITNELNYSKAMNLVKEVDEKIKVINISRIEEETPVKEIKVLIAGEDIAYIMYTSGSTGKPKGVIQSHKNVVHFVGEYINQLHISKEDRIMLVSSYSHATGVIDIISAILSGASVHIYDIKKEGGLKGLRSWLEGEGISIYHSIPTLYRYVLKGVEEGNRLDRIRAVVLGGESLSAKDVELYKKYFSEECIFVNLFGSTEVLIASSYIMNKNSEIKGNIIPIGFLMSGLKIILQNDKGEKVGVLGVGEIIYKSKYISEGYWKQEDKTKEVFSKKGEELAYRSGDLGKIKVDGILEYLGRKDYQIKIRGYRVEIGEIEGVMDKVAGVEKSVVRSFKKEDGEEYLVGYYVKTREGVEEEEIKRELKEKLPEYMMPSYFMHLEKMPLTPGGKIDRLALPEVDGSIRRKGVEYIVPRNEIEEKLVRIWQEILEVDKIGINDNFFDIGGNSLKLMLLNNLIEERLNFKIDLIKLINYPTICSLSNYLENINQGNKSEYVENEIVKKEKIEVAVIGISGRFPGAGNIDKYWENLKNGKETISHFTNQELRDENVAENLINNPLSMKARGIIDDIEYFDADFFEYIPTDAQILDPQVRIFQECVWEALEDAGYNPINYKRKIGMYAGAGANIHWQYLTFLSGMQNMSSQFLTAILNEKDYIATQTSYKLNLKGPSFTIDTACSTSLVAIHLACQSLLIGESYMTIAGGVSLQMPQKQAMLYEKGMILSPDGHCRAFDADAKGIVGGNGCGVVILKLLENAIKDRDNIYAVIKGSSINNDGSLKLGYTAPAVEGQADVINSAQKTAKVSPESITYVETHGTGTELGDPIEIEALKKVFNTNKRQYCAIGSVKTNIGHLVTAAGAAGFIKTVLALKNRQIPASLHFKKPNPKIDFENSPFYVNTELKEWKNEEFPLRAGVSSFGIGGTNAHVILEEAPEIEESGEGREWQIMLLSGRTETALKKAEENIANYLKRNDNNKLPDICYTLGIGRRGFEYRRAIVITDKKQAIDVVEGSEKANTYKGKSKDENRNIIFLFPGQGSQYLNMGKELYEKEKIFREEMDQCFKLIEKEGVKEIKEILYPENIYNDDTKVKFNKTAITQPVMFAVEYSLAKILMQYGVKPKSMIGHSLGEYAAACISGVMSLEEAIRVVVVRGQLMDEMPKGVMLSVEGKEDDIRKIIGESLDLAAVNSSNMSVVSGEEEEIKKLEIELKEKGITSIRLLTSHGFHSRMMEGMLEKFRGVMKGIKLDDPKIPYISNLTGKWISIEEAKDVEYWVKQLRNTVRFNDGLSLILKETNGVMIEVGAGNVLTSLVRQHVEYKGTQEIVNLMRHPKEDVPDVKKFVEGIARLWVKGVSINWEKYYKGENRKRVSLPTYPFERKKYWINEKDIPALLDRGRLNTRSKAEDWYYVPTWEREEGNKEINNDKKNRMIFIDNIGISDELIKAIKDEEVIIVAMGKNYQKESLNKYSIDPKNEEDYINLFNELKISNKVPDQIIYMWSLSDKKEDKRDEIDEVLENGYYNILRITNGIEKNNIRDKIRIDIVTNSMEDVTGEEDIQPEKSIVKGPVKIIPIEYPHIECKCIDIQIKRDKKNKERIIQQLLDELKKDDRDRIISYRGKYRWIKKYKKISLLNEEKEEGNRLKENGIYIITGGLGGLGLTFGEYLAKEVRATLILLGRSKFPERKDWETWISEKGDKDDTSKKIIKIKEIENLGGQVKIYSADISDYERMKEIVEEVEKGYGQINGIIHAAGTIDFGGMIIRRDKESSEKMFSSKVKGTLVLNDIMTGKELDFIVLCSSISTVIYQTHFGQVGYVAANEFLDSYANYLNKSRYCVSINWPEWYEAGMAVEARKRKGEKQNISEISGFGITPKEGQIIFKNILNEQKNEVVICPIDLNKLIDILKEKEEKGFEDEIIANKGQQEKYLRPELETEYAPPTNEVEEKLVKVWKKVLGIDKVGINDNFFELGGHSLTATLLVSMIHKEFDVEVSLMDIFEISTIKGLGEEVNKQLKIIDDILSELENK